MALRRDASGQPYFDSASPIVIDELVDVVQMVDDPGQADLSGDPAAMKKAQAFDQGYKQLLDTLHGLVNGQPNTLPAAEDLMASLTGFAQDLLGHQISAGPDAGKFAGPRFLLP